MPNGNTGEGAPLPPRKRAVRLKTARDARRFLAKLVNGVYRDEYDATKAAKIGYLLSIFIKSLEVDELADRLAAIEEILKK